MRRFKFDRWMDQELIGVIWGTVLFAMFFGSMILSPSTAQTADAFSLEDTIAKTQFEKILSDRLEEALRTTLKRGSYEVNVEIDVQKREQGQATQLPNPFQSEIIPQDLTLGVINAEPLIRMYAQKVADMERKQDKSNSLDLSRYEIKSMSVALGLVADFPNDYRNEMAKWLRRWANANFGNTVKTQVTSIREPPAKDEAQKADAQAQKDKEEKPESLLDKLSRLQGLISAAVIGLVLLIAILYFGFVASQNSKRHAEALVQGAQAAVPPPQPELLPETNENEEEQTISDESVVVMRELKEVRDVNLKIKSIYTEIGINVHHLCIAWMEAGKPGLYKLAALLDSQLDHSSADKTQPMNLPAIPDSIKPELLEIFREMPELTLQNKLGLLKDVYWDLMAVKVLGHGSVKRPFSYLAGMSTDDVRGMMEGQTPDVQALLVLNMPDLSRVELLKAVEPEQRKSIVKHSLSLEDVDYRDLEALSETVKNAAQTGSVGRTRKLAVLPLSMQMLQGLSALDEINILREVVSTLSDKGELLKRTYATLAFIDEWNSEQLPVFLERLQPDQVVTLLRQIPSAKDTIMKQLTPRMAEIVEDDLKAQDLMKAADAERVVEEIRKTLRSMVQTGVFDLDRVFERSGGEARAA